MATKCPDTDATEQALHSLVLEVLDDLSDLEKSGYHRYEQISDRMGRDSIGRLREVFAKDKLDDPVKSIKDLFAMLAELDGIATTKAEETLVKQLWQGGAVELYRPTLGVIYAANHVRKRASDFGLVDGEYFFVVELGDPDYHRRVDLVAYRKQPGDTVDNITTIREDDVLFSVEVKWYSSNTSVTTSEHNRSEIMMDLMRSLDRSNAFADLYYAVPTDYDLEKTGDIASEILRIFDDEITDTLQNAPYNRSSTYIGARRSDLEDRIANGMVFMVEESQ